MERESGGLGRLISEWEPPSRERERIVVPKKERLGAQFGKTFGHLKPCNYYRNETISSNILVVFYWSRSIF